MYTQSVLMKGDRFGIFKLAALPISHWLRTVPRSTGIFRYFYLPTDADKAGSSSSRKKHKYRLVGARAHLELMCKF